MSPGKGRCREQNRQGSLAWKDQRTVPKPSDEWVIKRETIEENNSGDDAPAAINVAPNFFVCLFVRFKV